MGCGTATPPGISDPLEPINRKFFAFNHLLDRHAAMPAASYYRSAVPDTLRLGIHNFLSNLTFPVTFANDILQGHTKEAGWAACRFGVNSTIGILGVEDRATEMGCYENDEDFGQTLGYYGVPGGPYLVLPFIGSALPRDIIGKSLVDHYFSPFSYTTYNGKHSVGLAMSLLKTVDQRSGGVAALRDVERTSLDYYAAMRSIYLQKRNSAIQNETAVPDFPAADPPRE